MDDIVCLSDTEEDLQKLLNVIYSWCFRWRFEVNVLKTNIMHVRKKRKKITNFVFKLGNKVINLCKEYKYLGVTVNEYLNFEDISSALLDSSNRALSGIITCMIKNGGFPLNVFKILYDSCVCSISEYGSAVWGFHQYNSLTKIHNRAISTYLGQSKCAPLAAQKNELCWLEPRSRTQINRIRFFHRLTKMSCNRLTKNIFVWDMKVGEKLGIKTWGLEIKDILQRNNLSHLFTSMEFPLKDTINFLSSSMLSKDLSSFQKQCMALPKLRTYNVLASFNNVNNYLNKPISFLLRKFYIKTKIGTLGLRIETGRYQKLKEAERICLECQMNSVEDTLHFCIICPKHSTLRNILFSCVTCDNFVNMCDLDKLIYLFSEPSLMKPVANFIMNAFYNRDKSQT